MWRCCSGCVTESRDGQCRAAVVHFYRMGGASISAVTDANGEARTKGMFRVAGIKCLFYRTESLNCSDYSGSIQCETYKSYEGVLPVAETPKRVNVCGIGNETPVVVVVITMTSNSRSEQLKLQNN